MALTSLTGACTSYKPGYEEHPRSQAVFGCGWGWGLEGAGAPNLPLSAVVNWKENLSLAFLFLQFLLYILDTLSDG